MDVSEVDFSDFSSVYSWLELLPKEMQIALAGRCALRLLPLVGAAPLDALAECCFQAFRATLVAQVGIAMWRHDSMSESAKSAFSHATFTANKVSDLVSEFEASNASRASIIEVARVLDTAANSAGAVSRKDASDAAIALANTSHIQAAAINADIEVAGGLTPFSGSALRDSNLWHSEPIDGIVGLWGMLRSLLTSEPSFENQFAFWVNWYQGQLDGTWTDWDLCHEIALIPPEEWDKGSSHIADLIREIEARRRKQFREQFTSRAPVLVAQSEPTYLTSEGVARQIEDAISRYMRDAGTNSIPEEFQVLEQLPQRFRAVAMATHIASQSDDRLAELEEKIADLAEEVLRLRAELERARAGSNRAVFSKAFCEQAGKSLGDWKMWGALSGGCWVVLGNPTAAEAMNAISGLVRDLIPGAMSSPPPQLPQGGGSIGV